MPICHRAESHRLYFEILSSSQECVMKLDPHRTPICLQQLAHPHHSCSASPRLKAGQLIIREARVNTTCSTKHHDAKSLRLCAQAVRIATQSQGSSPSSEARRTCAQLVAQPRSAAAEAGDTS